MPASLPHCIRRGLIAGAVAGIAGGLPSTLALSPADLDRSIQSIALLVPGNRRWRSPWARRAVGSIVHMSLSAGFSIAYSCFLRIRATQPRFPAAAMYGAVLWLVNYRLLGPKAMKAEDRSFALADHLCWAVAVELTLRLMNSRRRTAECG